MCWEGTGPKDPTFLWVVLESSVWSQDLRPPAPFSMPSSEVWD